MDPDPLNPNIKMGINDIITAFPGEPVIQQWSHTSSIVNGVFKVGTKQLNNEANALVMFNQGNTATIKRNNVLQQIDGANERFRFTNAAIDPLRYTEIGGSVNSAGTVNCFSISPGNIYANTLIEPTKITFNNSGNNGKAITGVNGSAPYQFYTSSKNAIEFVVDDLGAVITSLSLNKNGTNTMPSTLYVPTLQQGNIIQTLDNANTRTRFTNVADAGASFTEINQTSTDPSVSVVNLNAQTKITASTIAISNFTAVPSQVAKIGTIPSFPGTFMIESYSDTQIRTSILGLSTATFKANGNTELLSTLTVPYISTANIVATNVSTTNIQLQTANIQLATIPQIQSLSTINGYPLSQFFLHPGMMMPYARTNVQAPLAGGWLICDGQAYPTYSYPNLYAVIGTTYGDQGLNTFKVPDMRGRVSMGAITTVENNPSRPSQCVLNVTNVIDVITPSNWPAGAGLTYKAYSCTSAFGTPYLGMVPNNPLYDGSIKAVIYLENTVNIIIVMGSTVNPSVFPATVTLTYNTNAQASLVAPSVFNSDSFDNGVSNIGRGIYPQPVAQYEVPNHTHQMLQPGGTSSQVNGAQNRAGDPNLGGPTISVNNGLWSFTDPVGGGTVLQASGLKNLPPNLATWFIIKT